MYQTKLSHMFNCVNAGSTRLSKQRKFRIYILDDFFGNCYNGSFFLQGMEIVVSDTFCKIIISDKF